MTGVLFISFFTYVSFVGVINVDDALETLTGGEAEGSSTRIKSNPGFGRSIFGGDGGGSGDAGAGGEL